MGANFMVARIAVSFSALAHERLFHLPDDIVRVTNCCCGKQCECFIIVLIGVSSVSFFFDLHLEQQ